MLLSLILILTISIVAGVFSTNNPCGACHQSRGYYQYCQFDTTSSSFNIPDTIGNEVVIISIPITMIGSGSNQYYKINRLSVSLESKNNYITIDNSNQQWNNLYPGGTIFFTSPITGIQEGTDILSFTLSGLNSHGYSQFSDSYSHEITINMDDTNTQELAIKPSTWSIVMNEKKEVFQLSITQDIDQIELRSPFGVTVNPDNILSLIRGDIETIEINVKNEKQIEGNISIHWIENLNEKSIQINFVYSPEKKEEINIYSLIGRITGMLSFILLICSIILSGINRTIRRKIKQIIRTKKRVSLHCYISWGLFILSIFHGIILVFGPYSEFIWMPEIILGYVTGISMFIVSINGTFMNKISKIIGSKLWRKTHGYYSYLSLILCVIHALLIGTEFAFFRGLYV